jgi:hypothetical protein
VPQPTRVSRSPHRVRFFAIVRAAASRASPLGA